MKKILTILSLIVFLGFVASIMYVLEIPPFKGSAQKPATQEDTEKQQLPEFLSEEKVSRTKTYDEHLKRGKLLEDNGFPSLAIAEYQEANKLDPNNPEPLLNIGRVHFNNQEFESAKASFEAVLAVKSDSLQAKVYLGKALLQDRKIPEAKEAFNKISSETQEVKYYQGIIAAFFEDYDNSKKLLNRSIEIGGNDDLKSKAENFLNAFREFDFNQGGSPIHLKSLLSRSYDQTGEYQMAIPLLFEVIKEKKDYRDAWILLGYAYLNLNKYPDAIEALEKAKAIDPQKAETFFYLGLAYNGLNDLTKAAAYLEQAKSLGFQPVIQIEQKLGEIYLQIKDYQKAANSYQNVVSLNDDQINYYIRPIWLYIEKLNQPDKALALANQTLTHHAGEAMAYNLIAWAQIANNDMNEAQQSLQKALLIDPNLDAIYLSYGRLYEKKGATQTALSYYAKAHQMGQGNGISNTAAQQYNQLIGKTKNLSGSLQADTLTNN